MVLTVANFLYFSAEALKANKTLAIICLMLGRGLIGVGGAKLLTRKFVAINVEPLALTKYSAILVGINAIAICVGPGLASMLRFERFKFLGLFPVTLFNAFSFIYVFLCFSFFLLFYFFYVGYDEEKEGIK